uniref:Uncharacterized protein n=1 Tax=Romanomermis culicivorax TaxID=13658 RepID=A0A915K315_ROMCU
MGQVATKPVEKVVEEESRIVLSPSPMPPESDSKIWNDQSKYLVEFSVLPRKLTMDRPAVWTNYRLALDNYSTVTLGP